MINVDPTSLSILLCAGVPLLVKLLTHFKASDKVKASVNIVLTGFATFIGNQVVSNGHAVFSVNSLKDWAIGLAVSIGAYYGLIKPSGINILPNIGIGAPINVNPAPEPAPVATPVVQVSTTEPPATALAPSTPTAVTGPTGP